MPSIRKEQVMNTIYQDVHNHQAATFLGDNTDTFFRCPADPLNADPGNYKDTEKSPLTIAYPAFLDGSRHKPHLFVGIAYQVAMTGLKPARLNSLPEWGDSTVYEKAAQFIVFEALKPQFIGHFSEKEFFRTYRLEVIEGTLDMMQQSSTWAAKFNAVLKTLPCYEEVLEQLQSKGLHRITPLHTKYRHTHTLERDFAKLGNVLYPNATKVILEQGIHKSEIIDDTIAAPTMDALIYEEAAAYAYYHANP